MPLKFASFLTNTTDCVSFKEFGVWCHPDLLCAHLGVVFKGNPVSIRTSVLKNCSDFQQIFFYIQKANVGTLEFFGPFKT